jgi:hypothetical protein
VSDAAESRWPTKPGLGLLGRGVSRATVRVSDLALLHGRLEDAIRAEYENAGFEVRTKEYPTLWHVRAHRGFTGGFAVSLVNRPGPSGTADMIVGVSRSSRVYRWGVGIASVGALVTFVAGCLFVGFLQQPILLTGAIILGLTAAVALALYQVQLPVVVLLEHLCGGRFDDAQITTVVDLVRGVVEGTPGVLLLESRPESESQRTESDSH